MSDFPDILEDVARSPITTPLPGLLQYSSNLDTSAPVLWFVELPTGERWVLKVPRSQDSEDRFVARLTLVEANGLRATLSQELAIPMIIGGPSQSCTAQPLAEGESLLKQCRWRLRRKPERLFHLVLDIVEKVAAVEIARIPDWKQKSTWIETAGDQAVRPFRIGLVHNDLVPVNIIGNEEGAVRVIDWDEMDFAPSLFNLYEATLALGSLLSARIFQRRSIRHYAGVFEAIDRGAFTSVRSRFLMLHEALQPRSDGIEPAESLAAFLRYKSRLTGGVRDARWASISRHSARMIGDLEEMICRSDR
jgi:hypothetical protein